MSRVLWQPAYIGIGSNLDNPQEKVISACAHLKNVNGIKLVKTSMAFKNPPMGDQAQPDFINAVAAILTILTPLELLDALQDIETRHGRIRGEDQWGPRTLDLDLLIYADQSINSERLTVPHPGIAERAFVLAPLFEIAPDLLIPGVGRVRQRVKAINLDSLQPFDEISV